MAKDPAVLFYTSDFLSGTFTMDYEQKGKYITLLCLQHQKGKLTLKDLQSILSDEDIEVMDKFQLSDDGYYYNSKMKECADKRKSFSESRRQNRLGKTKDVKNISKSYEKDMKKISKSYVKHMENENENEIINKNITVNQANKLLDKLLDITTFNTAMKDIESVGGIEVIFSVLGFDDSVKLNWLNKIEEKIMILS